MTQLSNIAIELFTLSHKFSRFANDHSEWLNFGEYADLCELETKFLAFGNLLETSDPITFLHEEIASAKEHFEYLQKRVISKREKTGE